MASQPSAEVVIGYMDTLSNWGRWGADDQKGTLNHITPEHRTRAAQLVQDGRVVSCAREVGTQFGDPNAPAQMYWVSTGAVVNKVEGAPQSKLGRGRTYSAVEFFGMIYHGSNVTHLDTPAHIFWDGRMYNDQPAERTTSEYGATWCAVTEMPEGVVTRGVLVDVANAEGVDAITPGRSVMAEDLDRTCAAQNVEVGPGDVVLLRTGRWHPSMQADSGTKLSDDPAAWHDMAGWHPDCMPWLHARDVAMVGADVPQEARPPAYPEFPAPMHNCGLVAMGMPLIDNCDLEALSAACAELGRWEFQFVMAPLRLVGGSGGPVNPLAML